VLGCDPGEVRRLGRQHAIWRQDCQEGWRRGGFASGQQLLDLGCGPGFASLDLAHLVGSHGRVLAVDASESFITHLQAQARQQGLSQLETLRLDLAQPTPDHWHQAIPSRTWDGIWCRWLAMFLPRLDPLLDLIARALRPGGRLVLQEYLRWDTFSLHPQGAELACFVARCIAHWRSHGGDPDVASRLPALLERRGLRLLQCRSLIACAPGHEPKARWLRDFLDTYPSRLIEAGVWSPAEQEALENELRRSSQRASLWMTPGLIEMVWEQP
jgi:SAM-dependent methyltransferase